MGYIVAQRAETRQPRVPGLLRREDRRRDGRVTAIVDGPEARLPFDWPAEEMQVFCRKWRVTELAIFGSVLRADFGPESDIDLLACFAPGAGWSVFDHARMEHELSQILHRGVDLVTRLAVEESPNRNRREEILRTARLVYAA
jgi:uncharacterized protein